MKQISAVWVGNPFFHSALADLGWRVRYINPAPEQVLGWDELLAAAGFEPDVVVVADKSLPPFVTGMEKFPCLTAFYAVDTHIHSWFPLYAQGFDLCLVSLKDHIPLFTGMRLPRESVLWSPPYAKPQDVPRPPDPEKPHWGVLFVGTIDPLINPERCAFLDAVKSLVPELHATGGTYRELYPQASIVLNHTAANDLNFRVFEALGCGACLVTPGVGHGFDDIFRNGRDLFTFDQTDIGGLARLLRALLDAPARREKIAAHGHEVVRAGHYMHHRAKAFAAAVENRLAAGAARSAVNGRLNRAGHIRETWLRLMYLHHAETVGRAALEAAYLEAARGRMRC